MHVGGSTVTIPPNSSCNFVMSDEELLLELQHQIANVINHCYQRGQLHCGGCQDSLEIALEMLSNRLIRPDITVELLTRILQDTHD